MLKKFLISFVCIFIFFRSLYSAEPDISFRLATIEETGDLQKKFGNLYTLEGKNFPPNKEFIYYQKNLLNDTKRQVVFVSDKDGNLTKKNPPKPFYLSDKPLFKGEPIEHILQTEDKSFSFSKEVVMKPLEQKLKNGKTLRLTLQAPEGALYRFELIGFKPKETVYFRSISAKEILNHQITIDENGGAFGLILPFVDGLEGGLGSIEMYTTQQEHFKVHYFWGSCLQE